jgi:cation diffusion facilitator family transporter
MTFEIVQRKAATNPPPPPPPAVCDDDCCAGVVAGMETASDAFRRTVWVVMGLNAAMFGVEVLAGQLAGSMALQADALDFAGDTATYAVSLFAHGRSNVFRARTALVKSLTLGVMGVYVLAAALWRTFVAGVPEAITMGWVGALALAVNVSAALLLLRFRDGDANVRSVWLCSRNDAIGNLAVLGAAGVVALTHTRWADLAVAAIMAGLFLSTAWQVTRQARRELAQA